MLVRGIGAWIVGHKGLSSVIAVGMLLLAGTAGFLYWTTFAAVELDNWVSDEAIFVKGGTCEDGDIGHRCEGNVSIVQEGGLWLLTFEDFDATDGPDVWFYLTESGHEGDSESVEERGLLVLVPQTMNNSDGRAEVEGTFTVPLPQDFDPTSWGGLSVWCEDYNILMGSVAFSDFEG